MIKMKLEDTYKKNKFLIYFLLSGLSFLGALVVFRSFSIIQMSNIETFPEPFLQINGVHIHHWIVGFVILPFFIIFLFKEIYRTDKREPLILFLFLSLGFILGMIFDGMIGYNTYMN